MFFANQAKKADFFCTDIALLKIKRLVSEIEPMQAALNYSIILSFKALIRFGCKAGSDALENLNESNKQNNRRKHD